MRFKLLAFTAATVVMSVAVALPAQATESETVEVFWALPDGGTETNVTWPQTYLSDPTVLACGVTYQVDTYLASEAALFTADGVLELGEDYGSDAQTGAISWRFVYGGDCASEEPPLVCADGEEISNGVCVPADLPDPDPSDPPVTPEEPATPASPDRLATTGIEDNPVVYIFAVLALGVGVVLAATNKRRKGKHA